MRYLHTMLRVRDLEAAPDFFCNKLGLKAVRRRVDEKARFTLVFLAAPEDQSSCNSETNPARTTSRRTHLQLGCRKLWESTLIRSSGLRG
jgi:catechol 2,3-dioxygenase-like lactoylglutathione lyase family enzyme